MAKVIKEQLCGIRLNYMHKYTNAAIKKKNSFRNIFKYWCFASIVNALLPIIALAVILAGTLTCAFLAL